MVWQDRLLDCTKQALTKVGTDCESLSLELKIAVVCLSQSMMKMQLKLNELAQW